MRSRIAANGGPRRAESCQAYVDASMDHYQRNGAPCRRRRSSRLPTDILARSVRVTWWTRRPKTIRIPVLFDKSMTGVGSCGNR